MPELQTSTSGASRGEVDAVPVEWRHGSLTGCVLYDQDPCLLKKILVYLLTQTAARNTA
ncbi:MAG: hypothetical protein MIO93_12085 [ANME-2 cluster archaeon]|nr:hypothetical protein [ANME-2 cluster archaeon]